MIVPSRSEATPFDLSLEEQWLLHHVMLDRMELEARDPAVADPPPLRVFRVFEMLEAGAHEFTPLERACIDEELRRYVDTANVPDRDRPVVQQLLARLQGQTPADDPTPPPDQID